MLLCTCQFEQLRLPPRDQLKAREQWLPEDRRSALPCLRSQRTAESQDCRLSGNLPASGGLLQYSAVAEALEDGHIGGLGLDVQWKEPWDPEDPVSKHPNVILTPHVAGRQSAVSSTAGHNALHQLVC